MKIDFSYEQLALIDKAVQQLPFYLAAPLIAHINKEIETQKKEMDMPIELQTKL